MEKSMYILHEVHRPLIIFVCARQLHVHEEPGEDNGEGSQSKYWCHYRKIAGALTLGVLDGRRMGSVLVF